MPEEFRDDRLFYPIKPVADVGLEHHKPADETKWSDVINLVRRHGRWTQRPAHVRADSDTTLPASTIMGNVLGITEFKHPVISNVSETLRPDADGAHTDWDIGGSAPAASRWESVDEATPDDAVTLVETSTYGAKVSFGFANPGTTWTEVRKLTIRVRALRDISDDYDLKVYARAGGVDYVIGTVTIPATGTVEYTEVLIDSVLNPADDEPWEDADTDAVEIVLEHLASTDVETLLPSAAGNYNQWVVSNAASAWAALASDDQASKIGSGSAVRTSVAFGNLAKTYDSIPTVVITYRRNRTDAVGDTIMEVFAREGGTNNAWVASDNPPSDTLWRDVSDSRATHPDGDAWAQANVNSLEVGFRVISGTLRVIQVAYLKAVVTGIVDVDAVVTQVSVDIEGRASAGREFSKLYATEKDFFRVDEQLTTITRIQPVIAPTLTAPSNNRWDIAHFNTSVEWVNGIDEVMYYPLGAPPNQKFGQRAAATAITGYCCASFINRLIIADVTEGGVRSPQRVRWSDRNDVTGWAGATSGNLELADTPTRVVALQPLGSGVLVGLKRVGIYNLLPTGDSGMPLKPTCRNPDIGCRARPTVKLFTTLSGIPTLIFLGEGAQGLNVFQYDGAVSVPIGTEIAEELEDLAYYTEIGNSFSIIDPVGAEYNLFVCEGTDPHPKHGWTYNIRGRTWSKLQIQETTAAGIWTVNDRRMAILGRADVFTYKLDIDTYADGLQAIETTLLTGDYALGKPEGYWTLYRVFVTYIDQGTMALRLSASVDGGINFNVPITHTLGGDNDGSRHTAALEITPATGRRIQTKIEGLTISQPMTITEVVLEFTQRDTVP